MEPATFTSPDSSAQFDQDYQIDLYYERSPGELVHMFAVWRRMSFNTRSTDDDFFVSTALSSFIDWDVRMAELCQ